MTFGQRRNRLTTNFSERIPVVKRHMTVTGRWPSTLRHKHHSAKLYSGAWKLSLSTM